MKTATVNEEKPKPDIIRIGNVELTPADATRLYNDGKYIVTYSKIYALHYDNAQKRVYGSQVYRKPYKGGGGFVRRGRFHTMTAEGVNNLLGFKLLNTD